MFSYFTSLLFRFPLPTCGWYPSALYLKYRSWITDLLHEAVRKHRNVTHSSGLGHRDLPAFTRGWRSEANGESFPRNPTQTPPATTTTNLRCSKRPHLCSFILKLFENWLFWSLICSLCKVNCRKKICWQENAIQSLSFGVNCVLNLSDSSTYLTPLTVSLRLLTATRSTLKQPTWNFIWKCKYWKIFLLANSCCLNFQKCTNRQWAFTTADMFLPFGLLPYLLLL